MAGNVRSEILQRAKEVRQRLQAEKSKQAGVDSVGCQEHGRAWNQDVRSDLRDLDRILLRDHSPNRNKGSVNQRRLLKKPAKAIEMERINKMSIRATTAGLDSIETLENKL